MKIPSSIDDLYQKNVDVVKELKTFVDNHISENKNLKWHYVSRVKSIESFTLKIERGFSDIKNLDDFFGCTIVVENSLQIESAIELIKRFCIIRYKRPNSIDFTHKPASSFDFDDLRIYVQLKNDLFVPSERIKLITFEIQIKTFLFHAWSIAVHDLTYKSDEINWAKQRVAFQIRAMLEQAEMSIAGIKDLIELPELKKNNYETKDLNRILKVYKENFKSEELPEDLIRLCSNTLVLLKKLELEAKDFGDFIKKENDNDRGNHMLTLSPYQIVILGLSWQYEEKIFKVLMDDKLGFKIVMSNELLDFMNPVLRSFINSKETLNAILIE